MSEIEKKEDTGLNTSNIFDEFEINDKTNKEIKEISKDINKDWIYYLNLVWMFFKYINFALILILFLLLSYVFIQKSDSEFFNNKVYLNPICSILIWSDIIDNSNCSSLSLKSKEINSKLSNLNIEYIKKIVPILEKSYEIENIKNSRESVFIFDKSINKNDPILILNEFDKIKNDFTSIDKKIINCNDIKIDWNIFEANCSAYSTAWFKDIPWLKWEKTLDTIEWTSITLASSFINYLSNNENITILDKQRKFESVPYFWDWTFIYKTDFKLKFEYNIETIYLYN